MGVLEHPDEPEACDDQIPIVAAPILSPRVASAAAILDSRISIQAQRISELSLTVHEASQSIAESLQLLNAQAARATSTFQSSLWHVTEAIETANRFCHDSLSARFSEHQILALEALSEWQSSEVKTFNYSAVSSVYEDLSRRSAAWKASDSPFFSRTETARYFGLTDNVFRSSRTLSQRTRAIRGEVEVLLDRFEPGSHGHSFFATILGRTKSHSKNAPSGMPQSSWKSELRRVGRALLRSVPGPRKALLLALERVLDVAIELGSYLRSLVFYLGSVTQVRGRERPLVHHSIARHTRAMVRPAYSW